MTALILIAWYVVGFIGCILIWLGNRHMKCRIDRKYGYKTRLGCPTPRAILIWTLVSVLGPFILVIAVFWWTCEFIDMINSSLPSWWTTPLCDREKKS